MFNGQWVLNQDTGLPMAAGCLVVARDTGRILANFRSGQVAQGGSISTWGGALEENEQPEDAAKRELNEETGYSGPVQMQPVWVFSNNKYEYHNFLAIVPTEFRTNLNHESNEFGWKTPEEMDQLAAHFHQFFKPFYQKVRPMLAKTNNQIEMVGTGAVYDGNKGTFNWWGAPGSSGKSIEGEPIGTKKDKHGKRSKKTK